MKKDTNPHSVYTKSEYLGQCLEVIESDSNTTISESCDCSSTMLGSVNSVLRPFESTVIFRSKNVL